MYRIITFGKSKAETMIEIEVETMPEAMKIMQENRTKESASLFEAFGGTSLFCYKKGRLIYRKNDRNFVPDKRFVVIGFTSNRARVVNKCFDSIFGIVSYLKNTETLFMVVDSMEDKIVTIFENGKCIYSFLE